MKNYEIEIKINASKEKVWEVLTNFQNYPKWNSVLKMNNNDSLIIGEKFLVMISNPYGKHSKFKAKVLSKNKFNSFSARRNIIGKFLFSATHHFIIQEVDKQYTVFIQKWELKGIIASIFREKIFKKLALFRVMNNELKQYIENQK